MSVLACTASYPDDGNDATLHHCVCAGGSCMCGSKADIKNGNFMVDEAIDRHSILKLALTTMPLIQPYNWVH